MSLKKKEKDSPSGQSKKRFQATVGVALETIKIVKDIVPMEPAKGALELIYNLLSLLEVRISIPLMYLFILITV